MIQNLKRMTGIVFVLIALVIVACGTREDRTIAKVGDRVITLGQFEDEFSRGKANNVLASASDSLKLMHLNTMIDKELKILGAYDLGLNEDSSLVKQVESREQNEVGRQIWMTEVLEKTVPDAEVREFYENSQKQVHIRDILLRATDKDSADVVNEVEEKINSIYKDAKNGAKFDSLARRYSQDRGTAPKGGDRGLLKWDPRTSSNEMYQVAFQLDEGDISKPFKMKNGFHIIKIEKINIVGTANASFEKEKDRIRNRLMSARQNEIQEEMKAYAEKLSEEYNGTFNDDNIKHLVAKFSESKNENQKGAQNEMDKKDSRKGPNDFDVLTEGDLSQALFSYDGGEITTGMIVTELKRYPPHKQPDLAQEKVLRDFLERMKLVKLYVHEGYQRGYEKNDDVKKVVSGFIENAIHRTAYQQEVLQKVKPTEDELSAYYEVHQEKYKHPERREVQEIWVKGDRTRAERALREVTDLKRSFSAVAKKYNERVATKKKNGMLGFIQKSQYGDIGKKAFTMKVGQISDIIPMGRNFSVIKLLSIKEPELKTYEEVKFQVRNEVTQHQRNTRTAEWLDSLKEKHRVVVYENVLKEAFSGMKSEK